MTSLCFRFIIAVATLVCVATAIGWTSSYHIQLGVPAALVLGLATLLILRVGRPREDEELNWVREPVIGLLIGGIWSVAMGLYYPVATHYSGHIYDRNRAQSEQLLDRLEARQQWLSAIEILEEESTKIHSPEWTRELALRLILNLERAAEADPNRAEGFYLRAIQVAQQQRLPSDVLQSRLGQLRNNHESLRAAKHAAQAHLTEIETLKQTAAAEAAAAHTKTVDLENQLKSLHSKSAAAIRDATTKQADQRLQLLLHYLKQTYSPDIAEARQIAVQEISALKPLRISTVTAEEHLRKLDALIASEQPRQFASGTTIRLREIHNSGVSGLLLADLEFDGVSPEVFASLRTSDFVVRQGDRQLRRILITPTHRQGTMCLAILVDRSISMQGAAISAAKNATRTLISHLPPHLPLWLGSFSDRTETLASWTTDHPHAIVSCDRMQAAGHTALFAAISSALTALAERPEQEKFLLVFSDGANVLQGPDPEELITTARQKGIRIHSVALQGGQVDEQVLARLAVGTGGQSRVIGEVNQLGPEFRRIAADLNARLVRMAVLDYDVSLPCNVSLGKGPASQLTIPSDASRDRSSK